MLKSIILYAILVGLPLAGLFAILSWGESLEPPPAIGGAWTLEAEQASACPELSGDSVLSIQQSGRYLRIELDGRRGTGRLDDGRVRARVPVATKACDARELAIDVTLDTAGERLVGRIDAEACGACSHALFLRKRDAGS